MALLADLHALLEHKAAEFSPTEARLAAHLLKHPQQWGFESANQLAESLAIHRSSLVRFAQRLGFAGYPELQRAVREAFLQAITNDDTFTLTNVDQESDIRHFYQRELLNLRQTYLNLEVTVLEATARGLAEAERILVFGRRFSYPIALHLSLSLRTMRDHVRLAPEPGGASIDSLFDLTPRDYGLLVSLRRHSPEVQRTLELLCRREVPHTLLTDTNPAADTPAKTKLIRAHIGSTSVLDSYTALTSVSHALLALVSSLIPQAHKRLVELEEAWAWFSKR